MSPWWSRQSRPLQGTLQETPPAQLLRRLTSDRQSGTLTVTGGGDTVSLYLLFGHLFHAVGPEGAGESAVRTVLRWDRGSFRFDTRSKLPTEETITRTTAQLLDDLAGGSSESLP
jgi:hypothetical protein